MILLKLLQDSDSRLYKELTLTKASDIEKKVFQYAYDQQLTFGVTFNNVCWLDLGEPTEVMFSILDNLASRKLSGNAARDVVADYVKVNGDLIKLICNRDLDCGVTATTVNKVFPGLIPQFKVQLAKEVPIEKLTYPLLAQLKYDGVRVVITYTGTNIKFRTRNGKELHLPKTKQMFLDKFKALLPVMLDTEVTLVNGTTEDRTKVSGMLNSARSNGSINESLLKFNVFDYMPLTDFNKAKCDAPYFFRLTEAREVVKTLNLPNVKIADTYKVESVQDVNSLFEKVLADKQEGLILKSDKHRYSFKRSADWVKLKDILTADLQCVDIIEGTGKYEGMIGALVCEGFIDGVLVKVNVGSGLTDCQRSDHWSEYISHTIEVKYNSLIQDSVTKEWSLFLPRFVTVRFDK